MKSESKVKYPYGSLASLIATIFPSFCIVELFAGDGGVSLHLWRYVYEVFRLRMSFFLS